MIQRAEHTHQMMSCVCGLRRITEGLDDERMGRPGLQIQMPSRAGGRLEEDQKNIRVVPAKLGSLCWPGLSGLACLAWCSASHTGGPPNLTPQS